MAARTRRQTVDDAERAARVLHLERLSEVVGGGSLADREPHRLPDGHAPVLSGRRCRSRDGREVRGVTVGGPIPRRPELVRDSHPGKAGHECACRNGRHEAPSAWSPPPVERSQVTRVPLEAGASEHGREHLHARGVLRALGASVEMTSECETGELVQLAVHLARHPCMRAITGRITDHPEGPRRRTMAKV
jgi:hypothetical protein